MLKSLEMTGANIDEAVKLALDELSMSREEVSIEVIEKGKPGLLGFGRIPAKIKVTYESAPEELVREFIQGIAERMGISVSVAIRTDKEAEIIYADMTGENMGPLIGKRGDTLDAIQFLSMIAVNREKEEHWRVIVDTENYRAKREASLLQYSKKMADKAIKYRKPMVLEPMTPYERRIIHSGLKDIEGVATYSTGTEPNRRIVIAPAGMAQRRARNSYADEDSSAN